MKANGLNEGCMRSRVLLLCFILFFSFIVTARADADTDFRKSSWGMSPKQVKATEKKKPFYEDKLDANRTIITYKERIVGLSAYVVYIFTYGKLTRTKYQIFENHTNKTEYLSDYYSLLEVLRAKYRSPNREDTFWKNDLYKDDPKDWGMAVAVGHLSMFASWEAERTNITLALFGDNFKIDLGIEYTSKEYGNLEKKAQTAEEEMKF